VPDSACIQTGTTSTGIITQSQAIPPPDQGQPPVVPPACSITTESLENGYVGEEYSQQISVSAEAVIYSYTVTDGSLPDGLQLSSTTGVITGTPTTQGSHTFTVTVAGAQGMSCSKEISITIAASPWDDTYMVCNYASVSLGLHGIPGGIFSAKLPDGTGWYGSIAPYYVTLTRSGGGWTLRAYNGSTGVTSWQGSLTSSSTTNPTGTYTRTKGTYSYPSVTVVPLSQPGLCP
jgi:hypothetical protein